MSISRAISRAKAVWHTVGRNYNAILLEGCLEEKLRNKLQQKITYHIKKLNELR